MRLDKIRAEFMVYELLRTFRSTPAFSAETQIHNFCSDFILFKEMFSLAWKTIPLLFEKKKKSYFQYLFSSTSNFTINYRLDLPSESVEFVFFGNNICL